VRIVEWRREHLENTVLGEEREGGREGGEVGIGSGED
jgi:hypothetical protein